MGVLDHTEIDIDETATIGDVRQIVAKYGNEMLDDIAFILLVCDVLLELPDALNFWRAMDAVASKVDLSDPESVAAMRKKAIMKGCAS
jgi:hypothetical protein